LAAILFPVFAQAKAAAKQTASLSNIKQLQLATIMYGSDYDDYVPVMASWGDSDASIYVNGVGYETWAQITYPYTKNVQLLLDPQAPPNVLIAPNTGWNPYLAYWMAPQYGLNPYLIQPVGVPYLAPVSTFLYVPRSFTAVSRPADTVMLAQKYSSSETTADSWWSGWWFGANTWVGDCEIDPPDCSASGNTYVCLAGWGFNTAYGGTGGVGGWLNSNTVAGAWTGGASMRRTLMQVVSYMDGHVKVQSPSYLAAGTNYSSLGLPGLPAQNATSIVMTDMTVEHYYGLQ